MAKIRCPLQEAAVISQNEPCCIHGERLLTYFEMEQWVQSTAEALKEEDIGEGTRVGMIMHSSPRYIILLLALARVKAVACLINTRNPPALIREQLDSINCTRIFAPVREVSETFESFWVKHPDDFLVMRDMKPRIQPDKLALDAPATILFTSGSTGKSKAVLHTIGNHYYSAYGANLNMRLRSGSRWLLSLPLYHVGGLGAVYRCLLAGAAIVIEEKKAPLEESLLKHSITHLSLVPIQLKRMLEGSLQPEAKENLKGILLGGAPLPESLIIQALRQKFPVYATYGLSEMTSQVTTCPPFATPIQKTSAGRVLKYRTLAIQENGEILVRGKTLFAGYVEGDQLVQPCDEEGWFHTGDLGRIDQDEYLHVEGRIDNLFISGGENVQPETIEKALASIDGVEEAVVVPIEDQEFGQRPLAFLRTQDEILPERNRLTLQLEKVLPRYQIPVEYRPWPADLLKGLKIDRRAFVELVNRP